MWKNVLFHNDIENNHHENISRGLEEPLIIPFRIAFGQNITNSIMLP